MLLPCLLDSAHSLSEFVQSVCSLQPSLFLVQKTSRSSRHRDLVSVVSTPSFLTVTL